MNATVLLTAVDIDIPGYRLLRPIGEGGMASVFLAVQQSLDREVALKVMSPVLAANTEFASRFLVEGKITAKLQHPNLVTVHDIGCHKGVYYLAAEYIPGGTLKERIHEGGLSIADCLDIATDVAHGLDFAHQKGFVHRDVKPGNVLFRDDGRVVLADFGIAKAMDGSNSSTVAGTSVGTPDYMSPEQARGEPVDGRSDLYSLGTMLFEMLTGHPPYQASDPFTVALMHVTHPVPELPAELAWLQPLINGLMAKLPAERYNNGAAVVAAIQKLVAEAPANLHLSSGRKPGSSQRIGAGSATQQRTRISLSKPGERPAWLFPGVGIAGALVIALLAWKFWPQTTEPVAEQAPTVVPSAPLAGTNAPLATNFADAGGAPALAPQEVETALTQADAYLKQGTESIENAGRHLQTPVDDSAWYLYRRVLATQPDNARAKAGIAAIIRYYQGKARLACTGSQWGNCGFIARLGLTVDPSDDTLLKLDAAAAAGERGETPTLPPLPSN